MVDRLLIPRKEIVFLVDDLADVQRLCDGALAYTEMYLLDAKGDALQQMAAILEGRGELDAIHLLSHGASGELQLGTTTLNSGNVNEYAGLLAEIGAALAPNGDLLLYGCNVAEGAKGVDFIGRIAQLTGADVAASVDASGAAALGGNWELEYQTGAIESALPFTEQAIAEYAGVMDVVNNAPPTLTANGISPTFSEPDGLHAQAGSVKVFLTPNANANDAGQTITGLTFTVSGLLDGTDESFFVDGTRIVLGANSTGSTATNDMTYTVTVSGTTGATVVLSKSTGIEAAAINTLIENIAYQNTRVDDPTATPLGVYRVVTLTEIRDSGDASTSLQNIFSEIRVVPADDAPISTSEVFTTSEDVDKVLTLDDFGTYSDAADGTLATPLSLIKITMLEDNGSLEYNDATDGNPANWVTVTLDQEITPDAITAGKLRFVPDAQENGLPYTTIGFAVKDSSLWSLPYTLTVNVTPVNDPPVLTGDLAAPIDEGGIYTITTADLGYTDLDDTAANVFFTASDLTNGKIQVNGADATTFTGEQLVSGLVTFVHDGSETLEALFNVNVEDGNEDDSMPMASLFTLAVTPKNDVPVVAPDTATTPENTPLDVDMAHGVLSNDSDVDSTTYSVSAINDVAGNVASPVVGSNGGNFTVNADGSYAFDPGTAFDYLLAGAPQTTSITYTNTDSDGASANSTLTITITGVNDAPVAQNDTASVDENATLTVDAANGVIQSVGAPSGVDNDADTGDTLQVTGVSFNDVAQSADTSFATRYGALKVNADGSYSYNPDGANATVNALRTGESLTETCTYTVSDITGATSTATLTITINGVTDGAPTITPSDTTVGEVGDVTVYEAGLVTVTDVTETTSGNITVTVPDGLQSVTAGGIAFTVEQLAALSTVSPSADIDTGEGILTLMQFQITDGAASAPTAGVLSYRYTLKALLDHSGVSDITDTIALLVTDATSAAATDSNNLVVRIVDDVPTAEDDIHAVAEGATAAATVTSGNVFSGSTNGDVADYLGADNTATPVSGISFNGAAKSVGMLFASDYGSLTINADGSYTYSLDNSNAAVNALSSTQTLTEAFTYTITDADGDPDSATLTITITGANDAPVAQNDTASVDENATLTVDAANGVIQSVGAPSGVDNDADTGDTLHVTGVITGTAPDVAAVGTSNIATLLTGTYGHLTMAADGSYTYVADTAQAEALLEGVTAIDTFSYAVSDGNGGTSFATLNLTVTGVKDVALAINDVTVRESDGTATFTVTRTGDMDVSASVNYAISDGSAKVADSDYTASQTTGTLTFAAGDSSKTVTVAITDDHTFEQPETFTVTLSNPDTGTVITDADAVGTITDDDLLEVTGNDKVSEGSAAIFTVQLGQSSASLTDIALTLGTIGDKATVTDDYSTTMSAYYYAGATKTDLVITNGHLPLPENVTDFFVSVPTVDDNVGGNPGPYEGAEHFTLTAATIDGQNDSDTATILDDGTGGYDLQGNIDPAVTPDDDSRLVINNVVVNEGSPYIVFRVEASSNLSFTLTLADDATNHQGSETYALATFDNTLVTDEADKDYGHKVDASGNLLDEPLIQVYNGSTWEDYDSTNSVSVPDGGSVLLVRVPIHNDLPSIYERAHAFTLIATRSDNRTSTGLGIIVDDGTGAIFNDSGAEVNNAVKDDDLDKDGINPEAETRLANQATGSSSGDLNGDGVQDDTQNALATLAWRSADDFAAGKNGTPIDSTAIISIGVVDSVAATDSQISTVAQLLSIEVKKYAEIDLTTTVVANTDGTTTVTLANGTEVTTPWEPIRFGIEVRDDQAGSSLADVYPEDPNDPNYVAGLGRTGTQVRVLIDVRASGLTKDDANAYIKYVSADAITQAHVLHDLDGHAITDAGWYDFTQRTPGGDGALLHFDTNNKLVEIELIITDNAFGDNDLRDNHIFDPGTLAIVGANPVYRVDRPSADHELSLSKTTPDIEFYGVPATHPEAVALKAWYNPITDDYFYAPDGTPAPYSCYVERPDIDLGYVLRQDSSTTGVFDVHLYLNSAGITQIMGESAAAALHLEAQGYVDKGVLFESAQAITPTSALGADPYAGGSSSDIGTGEVLGGIAALGLLAWLAW